MHDVNGTRLKIGDKVYIPCVITSIAEGNEDFCNVSLETLHGRRPDNKKEAFSSINTAQVVLIEREQ